MDHIHQLDNLIRIPLNSSLMDFLWSLMDSYGFLMEFYEFLWFSYGCLIGAYDPLWILETLIRNALETHWKTHWNPLGMQCSSAKR